MKDREIRRRGVERLMELGRVAMAMFEGDEDEGVEELGTLLATWAGAGREEVDVEKVVNALRSLEDFVGLVDRLGGLGMNGGESDGTERAGGDADSVEETEGESGEEAIE